MKCENLFEKKFWEEGYECVLGMDEAGRGPIAGPLVVAGVVFPKGYEHDSIYDSKKLSEKKREELFEEIKKDALFYTIEIISEAFVDEHNIYAATQMTMENIVEKCSICEAVLSDAMPLPHIQKPYVALVRGSEKCQYCGSKYFG